MKLGRILKLIHKLIVLFLMIYHNIKEKTMGIFLILYFFLGYEAQFEILYSVI